MPHLNLMIVYCMSSYTHMSQMVSISPFLTIRLCLNVRMTVTSARILHWCSPCNIMVVLEVNVLEERHSMVDYVTTTFLFFIWFNSPILPGPFWLFSWPVWRMADPVPAPNQSYGTHRWSVVLKAFPQTQSTCR